MATFKLVQQIDGDLHVTKFGAESDFIAAMDIRGYTLTGMFKRPVVREQLQGQPVFSGLCGPMWDGPGADGLGVIRYEDQGANDTLSA